MHVVTYELEAHELARFSPETHDRLALVTEGLVASYSYPPGLALTGSEDALASMLYNAPPEQRIEATKPSLNASLNAGMYIVEACLPMLVTRKVNRTLREHILVNRLTYDYRLEEEDGRAGSVTLHAARMSPLACYSSKEGATKFSVHEAMLSGDSIAAGIAMILHSYITEGLPDGTRWELTGVSPYIPEQRPGT